MAEYDYSLLHYCGSNTFIHAHNMIRRPHLVEVGSHSAIDWGFYCTTKAKIGDHVHISPYVTIIGGEKAYFSIGDFCNLSIGCRIICGSDKFMGQGLIGASIPEEYQDQRVFEPVRMEMCANVGANTVIMPGVTLAQGTVVGACSLVTRSTEPWGVYVGVPVRRIKDRPRDRMLRFAQEMGYSPPL